MSEPRRLARYLDDCRNRGVMPAFARADVKLWVLALDDLVKRGSFDTADYAAARLQQTFSDIEYFGRMAMFLSQLPPAAADPDFAAFAPEPSRDIEIVRLGGATTVLFAFTGRFGGLGVPLPLLHRWFGQAGCHVVYLRDRTATVYNGGIASLAPDYTGTVRALKRMARDLGAERIACYGNSSGGYGALRYALDLPASRVLAFGPVTDLSSESLNARVSGRLQIVPGPDLRSLYEAADRRPAVRIVYGAENAVDSASAQRFAGLADVALKAMPSCSGHDAVICAIERGQFAGFLAELVRLAQ